MDREYESMAEKQISSEKVFDGKILHLYRDEIELPDGHESIREVIRHVGAVCIVAVNEDMNIVLERQYRYPPDEVMTEIPAGKLDFADEIPLEAAKRELKEETGYEADCWKMLGLFYSAPAYSDEKITMFLATGLKKGERHLDEGELLDVFEIPLKEAFEKVMNGEITDSKTQTGILKAYNMLICS